MFDSSVKNVTLVLALTPPIIWGLDLAMTNIFIAVAIWVIEAVKWLND